MILNILILFLCTSCCACTDCGENTDYIYLRIVEDGENVITKYDIKDNNGSSWIEPNRVYFTTQQDVEIETYIRVNSDYLIVGIYDNYLSDGENYKLWVKDKSIGNIKIEFKFKKNVFDCCGSSKIETFESKTDSVTIVKKSQEDKQPFYEIQF